MCCALQCVHLATQTSACLNFPLYVIRSSQARYSPIDFDYLGYSAMRWREYYRRKEEFMAEAARLFGSTAVA